MNDYKERLGKAVRFVKGLGDNQLKAYLRSKGVKNAYEAARPSKYGKHRVTKDESNV